MSEPSKRLEKKSSSANEPSKLHLSTPYLDKMQIGQFNNNNKDCTVNYSPTINNCYGQHSREKSDSPRKNGNTIIQGHASGNSSTIKAEVKMPDYPTVWELLGFK